MRITIVGVGNDLRADDGIGIHIGKLLEIALPKVMKSHTFQFLATQAPENYVHRISRFMPDLVIVVDSADFHGAPGEHRLIQESEVEGFTFSTHNAPLTVFLKAVRDSSPSEPMTMLVGIQPKNTGFGERMSREVNSCAKDVMDFVTRLIEKQEKIKNEEDSPVKPLKWD